MSKKFFLKKSYAEAVKGKIYIPFKEINFKNYF